LLKDGSKTTRSEKARGRNVKWIAYVLIVLITLLQILFPQGAGWAVKREVSESIVIGVMLLAIVLVGNELLPRLKRRYEQSRSRTDR
jgi:hypothetical protein